MDRNGLLAAGLAACAFLLAAFGILLYLAYVRYNWSAVLRGAATEAMEEACLSIVRIDYRTGKCVFIKDSDNMADALYREYDWNGFRTRFLQSIHPKDSEMCRTFTSPDNLRRVREKGSGSAACAYRKRCGDTYRWVQAVLVPMDGKRNGNCVLMFDRDVEESVGAEECHKEQLWDTLIKTRHSEAAKADFIKYLSRELRVPVGAAGAMCALAWDAVDTQRTEDARYYMKRIRGMGNYMAVLLEDVMQMCILDRRIRVRREAFSVHELLDDCREYALAWGEGAVGFALDTDGRLREQYVGDAVRLSQVIYCLLSNACRFSYEGGDVRLLAKLEESGEGADRISFSVKDQGCGIGEDFLPEMFEAFTRERRLPEYGGDGTGLGLYLAKAVTEALDGSIRVESRQGEGSCFTVDLWLEHVSV